MHLKFRMLSVNGYYVLKQKKKRERERKKNVNFTSNPGTGVNHVRLTCSEDIVSVALALSAKASASWPSKFSIF